MNGISLVVPSLTGEVDALLASVSHQTIAPVEVDLVRGVDSELFYRVRRAGYRLVIAPDTWVEHPASPTLGRLVAKHFRYGTGYAQEVRRHPELAGGRYLATPAHAAAYVLLRTALV